MLLGSRTLEGLNFRVEPVTKQLVDRRPPRPHPLSPSPFGRGGTVVFE
jgi:hypothetical protein